MKLRLCVLSMMLCLTVAMSVAVDASYLNDKNTNDEIPSSLSEVHQEMLNETQLDTKNYTQIHMDDLQSSGYKNPETNQLLPNRESGWQTDAVDQILIDAPTGSTYPEIYSSKNGNKLIVIYKQEDGTIVQQSITPNASSNMKLDSNSNSILGDNEYKITEKTFQGEPLPSNFTDDIS